MGRIRPTSVEKDSGANAASRDAKGDARGEANAPRQAPPWLNRALRRLRTSADTPTHGGRDMLLLLGAIIAVLARGGAAPKRTASGNLPPTTANSTVRSADVRSFAFAQPGVGPMQPGLGQDGAIWVGEMTTNHLTRLDPRTGQ